MRSVAVAVFALAAFISSIASAAVDPVKIDALFAALDSKTTPGAAVAIVKGGEAVFARAYGMADLEHGAAVTLDTPFQVASVAKQFTAYGVLLLEKRGLLKLDDDARLYLPDLPDYGRTITIRHLLTHTSGLPDQYGLWGLAGGRGDDAVRQADILRLLYRRKALNFAPGEEFLYVNSGYVLAATIIEKVTGQGYAEWMRENVFLPNGMTNTYVRSDYEMLLPGRAESYRPKGEGEGYSRAVFNSGLYGSHNIYASANDLIRWLALFRADAGEGGEIVRRMQAPTRLASGQTIPYGMGLAMLPNGGLAHIHHTGIDAGYRAYVGYFPDVDGGVVFLSNAAFAAPMSELAKIAFGSSMTAPQSVERAPSPLPEKVVEALEGVYVAGPGPGAKVNNHPYEGPIAVDGGPAIRFVRSGEGLALEAPGFAPAPIEGDVERGLTIPTRMGDIRLLGDFKAEGGARNLRFAQYGVTPLRRVEPWKPAAAELKRYEGRYFSPELETFYSVSLKDGALVLTHRRADPVTLTPDAGEGRFLGTGSFNSVQFETDGAGEPKRMAVSYYRMRRLMFERVEE